MSKNVRIYHLYIGLFLVIYESLMIITKAITHKEFLVETILLSIGTMILARVIDYYITRD